MMNSWIKVVAFVILLVVQAWAQPDRFVLSNATVHTAVEKPFVGYVVVNRGVIESVGRGVPPAGPSVDLKGAHLYPGLIEADTTLGLVEVESLRATRDHAEVGTINPNLVARLAYRAESDLVSVARSQGILFSGVNPKGGLISGQGSVMRTWGWTWEDMTVSPTWALVVDWPSELVSASDKAKERKKTLKSQGEKLFELQEAFAEARSYQGESLTDAKWGALKPYAEGGSPVVVRTRGRHEIRAALDWSEKEKIEIVLVARRDVAEFASELASRNVPVIYEVLFNLNPTEEEPYDLHYRTPKLLQDKGVRVALSSSGLAFDARELRDLAGRARAFGCTELEALQMITLNPARILGVQSRLGSIEKGKEASFVLCQGNILEVSPQVTRAWGAGREIDLEDPQKALYRKYRERLLELRRRD